jgi:hypothetical protein
MSTDPADRCRDLTQGDGFGYRTCLQTPVMSTVGASLHDVSTTVTRFA